MSTHLQFKSIAEIHEAFDQKILSPVEFVRDYLAAARGEKWNAYLCVTDERAMAQAKEADRELARLGKVPRLEKPLFGIPMAVKDNLVMEGVRTTAASKMLENYIPPYTATAVERLEAAGAISLGKTNLDEFAMGGSNENSAFGPVKHPAFPERVPGGSSGGSAAAVSGKLAHFSLGSDTGGSIRLPASFTGIVGFKPSYGRVSRYGLIAFASSLDQIGPFAETVEDVAKVFEVMSGFDVKDGTTARLKKENISEQLSKPLNFKSLKIGVPKEYFVEGLSPDVEKSVRESLAWFESQGATLVPISLPHSPFCIAVYYIVAVCEASSNLARFDGVRFGVRPASVSDAHSLDDFYKKVRSGFGEEVKRRIILGTFALSSGYSEAYYTRACQVRRLIKNDFTEAFKQVDVIMGPVAPSTAFKLGEKSNNPLEMYLNDLYAIPANLAGLPAISVPCGVDSSKLPIGLHMMSDVFTESKLLSIANAFQKGRGLMEFEAVIGLEVHVQLATESKIFCSCRARQGESVSDVPANSSTCPVCTGQPGSLPVLNKKVVEYAVRAGLATGCRINLKNVFSRKNYFYPDLPKGYQISQFDQPICENGFLTIETSRGVKKVVIQRIHMEEDAGKSVHMSGYSLVSLNRAGVPLCEVVSGPDMSSSEEAGAYLRGLYSVVTYLGICDGNLQEGNFRCDANVSVMPKGSKTLGTRAEIKNVNSFRYVEKAIDYEIARQIQVIEAGGRIVQETRLYDSDKNVTVSMRSKEEAQDYRYFPDPDLMTVELQAEWVKQIAATLPELPEQKKARLIAEFGLSSQDAAALTSSQSLAKFFEDVLSLVEGDRKVTAKSAANFLTGEITRLANDEGVEVSSGKISARHLADLIRLVLDAVVSSTGAKQVMGTVWKTGEPVGDIVEREGLKQVSDLSSIEPAVDKIIAANPDNVAAFRAGKEKLLGFFVGQVMKETGGKANPALIQELVKKKLKEGSA